MRNISQESRDINKVLPKYNEFYVIHNVSLLQEQITIVGLSGIIPQIWQLDFN